MVSHKYTRFQDESDGDSPTLSASPRTRWWPSASPLREVLASVSRIGRSAQPSLLVEEVEFDDSADYSPVVRFRPKHGWLKGQWKRLKWRWLMPMLQLSAESYVGLVFWTALVAFIRDVYWFQLQKGGIAPEIGFLAYLFTPAVVLGQPTLRDYLDLHPWTRSLMLLCGLVGIWGQSRRTPLSRLSFSANSVAIMSLYVFEGFWAGTAARRRRTGFGMIGGILLLQALQWAYAGPNPIVASTWGFVLLGVFPGVCTAFIVLTEDVAEWEGEDIGKHEASFTAAEVTDSADALSDDFDGGGGDSASYRRIAEFERRCRLGLAGDDDLEDVEMQSIHMSSKGMQAQDEVQSPLPMTVHGEGEGEEEVAAVGQKLSFPFDREDAPLVTHSRLQDQEGTEMVEMDYAHLPNGSTIEILEVKADVQCPPSSSQVAGVSLQCWEDETIGKRWGEGEEVPWLDEIGGVEGSSDSDFNMYRKRGWKWTKAGCSRTVQMGVGFGSLLFLTHWLFTSPNCLYRWSGASVSWGWLSICSLAFGTIFSAEVARNQLPKQVQALVAWLCAATGALLVLQGVTSTVIGSALLSFSVPSLWMMMPRNIFGVYPGSGLGIAMLLYVVLFVWSTALLAYESMPGMGFLRGTRSYLMSTTIVGIGVGLARGLDVSPQEKWEFGARMGAWRTGTLTWGSGVPGRKAVGTLIGLVGVILATAFVVRLQHASIWRGWNLEGDLRVINLNVQQGFSRSGKLNYASLYDVFTKEQPHVIMLQETDMMHIVHGNMDLVDYLATWMKMRSLYSPPTRSDSWGCALLSVVSFEHTDWEVLPSPRGENACFQHANILFQGKSVDLVNAHFGVLEDEIVLQAERTKELLLGFLDNNITAAGPESQTRSGVRLIFGGDINAAPLSIAYNSIISSGLIDGYVATHGEWNGPGGRDPGAGYIFSSPAANCSSWNETQYDQKETTDGYPVVATFELPL